MRVLLAEEAALQSGMYATHDGVLAKETLVFGHGNLQEVTVGIGFPTGIALTRLRLGTSQLEHGLEGIGHIVTGTEQTAALTAVDLDGPPLGHHVDAGQIGTGLHEGDVLRHGEDAVGDTLDGIDQLMARGAVYHRRHGVGRLQKELHGGLRHTVLFLDVGGIEVPVDADGLLHRDGNGDGGTCLAGNGVVQSASLYVGYQDGHLLQFLIQEAEEQFVGIGTLFVDIVTGVTARQALHAKADEELALRRGLLLVVEGGRSATTAGTGDKDFALVLRVEVDEVLARHEVVLHALGTGQAGLLVAGEDALQRTMLQTVVGQNGHLHGHANAIVGSQGGTLGPHPFAIDVGLDGIAVEVELAVGILLAHHIHVALQDDGGLALHPRRSGFAYDDIAHLVATSLQAQLLPILEQEVYHPFLALGGARHLVHLCKALKHTLGFQHCFAHNISFFGLYSSSYKVTKYNSYIITRKGQISYAWPKNNLLR